MSHKLKYDNETKSIQLKKTHQIFKCERLWMADTMLLNLARDDILMLWHVLFMNVDCSPVLTGTYWNELWLQGGFSLPPSIERQVRIIQITLSNPLIGIKHRNSSAEGQCKRSSHFSMQSWLVSVCSEDLHGKHPRSLILNHPEFGSGSETSGMRG